MFSSRTNWPLAPNRLSEAVAERRQRGLEILDLTESNPTRAGFEFAPEELLDALGDPRFLRYEPDPRGLRIAREAVAAYYGERGVAVDPEQVFLTTSTSEAYSYVFRLLADPGDRVLAPRPSYPLFDFLARLDDVDLTPYPLVYDHEWRIDFNELRNGLRDSSSGAAVTAASGRARAILVVHPNNPTGSFAGRDEAARLVDLCRSHDTALIADEVFADYALVPPEQATLGERGRRAGSFASTTEALAFTLSGLSKISALPQMKLAWIVVSGPDALRHSALERLEVIADTYLSVSAPLAYALPQWLEMRHGVQPQIMARLRSNLRYLDEQIAAGSSLSRLEVEGGWYAILRVPATRSDEDWALELVQSDGVLVHPGHFYDFPSDGFLVVSLLTAPEIFEPGLRSLMARVSGHG
ncbi:MAG TPA: pyridoxal phosphate-dependent aminotransferase [Terriglobia bacterium]|nr:pyridoxal phosphate-dependent aminotransferase [Terriglobia bacterium]